MAKADVWMPLYIGDYLADTMHLNNAQHGSYLLLLMHQWRAGVLPSDAAQLAAIGRCDIATWNDVVGPVILKFFHAKDGGLIQKRLEKERGVASDLTDIRATAGKAGAEKRWGYKANADSKNGKTDSKRDSKTSVLPLANDMANGLHSDAPSPSPSPLELEERKKERIVGTVSKIELPTPPVSAKALPQLRGSRLQNDWKPTESDLAYAESLSLDPGPVADEFRFYWTSVAGKAGLKLNWSQAFKGHCLRQSEQRKNRALSRASPANQPFRNGFAQVLHDKYNKPQTQDIFATKLLSRNEDEK